MLDQIRKANSFVPPQKIVIYGVGGIGKTTFGSTFPAPILLPIEDGASAVDIDTFPIAKDYQGVENAMSALYEKENPYKTLIVDSLDWLEPLVWEITCQANEKPSIESFGYGKGYLEADRYWRRLLGGFDALRADRGMNIVLLAHSEIKTVAPPDSDSYDRYQMRLQKRAFALWYEWAETVGFLTYKIAIKKEDKGFGNDRTRATGSGDRVIYTTERPAWAAKNHWTLPDEIFIGKDETYGAFHKALETGTKGGYKNEKAEGK
jgi:hypothetical protein